VSPLKHHVFICTNERPADDPKGCCASKGAGELVKRFKEEVERQGLKGHVRAQKAGCLDVCGSGPAVVVYPEGVWYGRVEVTDVQEIVTSHLAGGKPVDRLRIPGR
jgi:(2Fe-2S) ferredoxin